MYDWVTLLYSRNWYNIVNQLYFNKKNQKKEKFPFTPNRKQFKIHNFIRCYSSFKSNVFFITGHFSTQACCYATGGSLSFFSLPRCQLNIPKLLLLLSLYPSGSSLGTILPPLRQGTFVNISRHF